MKRRTAIKNMSLIAAGAALLPSCSDQLKLLFEAGADLGFNDEQNIWLESISEAIVPKGEKAFTTFEAFPEFVSKMMKFRHDDSDISTFVNGYNLCTAEVKDIYGSDTTEITAENIVAYFTSQLSSEQDQTLSEEEAVRYKAKMTFCQQLRGLAIQHLTTSKEYQEEVLDFKLVPDTYQSCVAV